MKFVLRLALQRRQEAKQEERKARPEPSTSGLSPGRDEPLEGGGEEARR